MAQLTSLLIGLVLVTYASASRIVLKAKSLAPKVDVCGEHVTGATTRDCYSRLYLFNTCGDATCKCEQGSIITGDDKACDHALYDEGRHFNYEALMGKGCGCGSGWNPTIAQDQQPQNPRTPQTPQTPQCAPDAPHVCHQCKFKTKTAKIADFADMNEKVDETFPIRRGLPEHGLPEEIQGVFWFTDQRAWSSLVSFAKSNDGGGFGGLDQNTRSCKVRVSGDRVWSFSDREGNMDVAKNRDLVYDFRFDHATHPRKVRIVPTVPITGIIALGFPLYLLECKDNDDDPHCKEVTGFEKSFVWQRKNDEASNNGTAFHDYKIVQIIKPDGTKLPAFQHWMDYSQKTEEKGKPGKPGEFHYREIDNGIQCE